MVFICAVLIAVVVVYGGPSKWLRLIRGEKDVGEKSGAVMSQSWMLETISSAGSKLEPTYTFTKSVHRTTMGVRLLCLALAIAAYFLAFPAFDDPNVSGSMVAYSPIIKGVLTLCLGYAIAYTWVFQVSLEGHEMESTSGLFSTNRFDLRELELVTEDGPYELRLYFSGRRPVRVMKAVVGADVFRQHLVNAMEANRMDHAGVARG